MTATLPPPPTRAPTNLPEGPFALPAPPPMPSTSRLRRWGSTLGFVGVFLVLLFAGFGPAGALIVGFLLITPLERAFRRHPQAVRRPGLRTDMVHLLFTGVLTSVGAIVAIVGWFLVLLPVTRGIPNPMFDLLPAPVQAIGGFILFETMSYGAHRAMHEVPLFWKFHAVHHSSRNLDWISGARGHPVEGFIAGAIIAPPLLLLGLRAETLGVLTVITGFWGILLHANIRWRFRWMDGWWGTPDYHHWHHSNHPEARNKNYAAFLPFIDRLAGTYWQPADRRPQIYGIDEPMPATWFAQMVHPLRRSRPRSPSGAMATSTSSRVAPIPAERLAPAVMFTPHESAGRCMTPPSSPPAGAAGVPPGPSPGAATDGGDRALVGRVAQGDRRALEALYRLHAGWLTARLHGRCQDSELVDSALQDTFLAVWKGAASFRGDGDVGAWLWGIALRRLIDQLRKKRPAPVDPMTVVAGMAASAEAELFAAGIGGELARALAHLEPELQSVMLLTAVDGLSTKEVATVLGIPQGTVKTRLMRARHRLQEGLR